MEGTSVAVSVENRGQSFQKEASGCHGDGTRVPTWISACNAKVSLKKSNRYMTLNEITICF